MKHHFKKGEIHDIYMDYKNEKQFLGKAKLVEFVEEGLSFYPDGKMYGSIGIVYNSERWVVEFVTAVAYPKGFRKRFNIRYEYIDSLNSKKIHATYKSNPEENDDDKLTENFNF